MLIEENVSVLAAKLGSTPGIITKFLTDAAASEEVKPFADTLGTLHVFKADELAQRDTNLTTQAAQKAKNDTLGTTYGAMDERIQTETGIAKKTGESTIEYMARAAKEKYGTRGDESAEMTRLRGDLTAAQELVKQTNTKLAEVEVAHATEKKQTQINGRIDAPINALNINTTPELLDSQREYLKYRLFQKYDVDLVDGKEQFTDKVTKEVKRDPKTAAPMTAAALVAEFAPQVVSLKKSSTAQPSGFNPGANDFTDEASAFDFSKYASKEEFAADLNKQGIASGSPEGAAIYKKFKAARPDLK
jgi:hypothetical protein